MDDNYYVLWDGAASSDPICTLHEFMLWIHSHLDEFSDIAYVERGTYHNGEFKPTYPGMFLQDFLVGVFPHSGF